MVSANQFREHGRGLSEVSVDIVAEEDEARCRDLMQAHHCLGAIRPVGETLRHVACHRDRWLAFAASSRGIRCGISSAQ